MWALCNWELLILRDEMKEYWFLGSPIMTETNNLYRWPKEGSGRCQLLDGEERIGGVSIRLIVLHHLQIAGAVLSAYQFKGATGSKAQNFLITQSILNRNFSNFQTLLFNIWTHSQKICAQKNAQINVIIIFEKILCKNSKKLNSLYTSMFYNSIFT